MTTLFRRLAERAVRVTVPAPPWPGLEVVDDERVVDPAPPSGREPVREEVRARLAEPNVTVPAAAMAPAATAEFALAKPAPEVVIAHHQATTSPTVAAVPVGAASAPPAVPPARPGGSAGVAPVSPRPRVASVVLSVPVAAPVWPAAVPPGLRQGGATAGAGSGDAGPTVQVHIGRLDVRAAPLASAPAAPSHRSEGDGVTELPLSDYLRGKRVPG